MIFAIRYLKRPSAGEFLHYSGIFLMNGREYADSAEIIVNYASLPLQIRPKIYQKSHL
jgi:hypothetical protein